MENKDKKFMVEYWDDEDKDIGIEPHWQRVSLEMCRHGMLCEDCEKDIEHMDNCDYAFDYTFSEQVAKDKKENIESDGLKARIINK